MNHFDHARHLATGIAGARLVPLNSGNHIVLADEPARPVFVAEVRDPDEALVQLARDAGADPGRMDREYLLVTAHCAE